MDTPTKFPATVLRLVPTTTTTTKPKKHKSRRKRCSKHHHHDPSPAAAQHREDDNKDHVTSSDRCICLSCKSERRLMVNPSSQPFEDQQSYSHFLRIPEKLRVLIFRHLPIRDRIRCQRVCRQFRFDIRVRAGTAGFVDENTFWSVTLCRDVVVDTIAVGRFHNPPSPPSQLIYRPENVRHLIFTGPISITYVDAFLRRCRDSTQRLTFRCPVVEKSPCPSPTPRILNQKHIKQFRRCDAVRKHPTKLHHATLLEIFPPPETKGGVPPDVTVKNITDSIRFNSLTHIVLSTGTTPVRMEQVRAIHAAVFSFAMGSPNLSLLAIDTRVDEEDILNNNNKGHHHQQALKPEREVNQVARQIQLHSLILTEEIVDFTLWNSFVILQHNLRVVQVMHLTNYPVVAFMIKNNASTLTKVAFHCLLLHDAPAAAGRPPPAAAANKSDMNLDLSLFSACHSLKELFVCVAGPYHPLTTDVINFGGLPRSLEVLALRNVLCSSIDLLDLLALPKLRNVGLVTFPAAGTNPSHYLSAYIFTNILSSRTLDEVLLQGFTLKMGGVEEVYWLAAEVGGLYSGILNAVHVCDEGKRATRTTRWVLSNNNTFVFQLFDRHIFAK